MDVKFVVKLEECRLYMRYIRDTLAAVLDTDSTISNASANILCLVMGFLEYAEKDIESMIKDC